MTEIGDKWRKFLLVSGFLASLLAVGTDWLAGMLWEGYSFTSQSISELSAIGAPTRSLVLAFNLLYALLLVAFGLGVWGHGRKRVMRIIAGLLLGNAAITVVVVTFFPMHLGETLSAIHLGLMAVNVILLQMLTILFGAVAFRNWFRHYSIGTLLAFLVLTVFGIFVAPQIIPGPPQSGLQERVMGYSFLLWQALLSLVLLRMESRSSQQNNDTKKTRFVLWI
ncbi:MAG: DUF998 domain-containing protein [Candidatus Bathyarchaeota archaeon]|nr:DUF998 domain-containing protein [Candidatus Bathyarchaeum sp.]